MSSAPDGSAPELPLPTASTEEPKPARTLGPLRMVWAAAGKYPREVLFALLALITTAAATTSIPYNLKNIIDKGFGPDATPAGIANVFELLMAVVLILGIGTAIRFYYVS
ncbi:MAG: hypothetical protein RL299_1198, partial [Pseudomonadota bacterium]